MTESWTASILVVDDDLMIRSYLEKVLTHDGHEVVTAENGEVALARIAEREFDLALVDLKMPGLGGTDVLAALRVQSPDTVPIILTAHASLETAVDALRQGAHDYLFKPCRTAALRESVRSGLLKRQRVLEQRELLGQLKDTLGSPQEGAHAVPIGEAGTYEGVAAPVRPEQQRFLQRGGLIVDCMRHVVTLDGQLLELSLTEFELLAYLVSEAPRVVSPQELAREVQGYDVEPHEAQDTVRYHIYRIRRKMKAVTGRTGVIRNVRSVGYTIGEQD